MAMAELMAQAVAQAMRTVPNRNGPIEAVADPDLDAIAANSRLPAMSSIAQANMLSWCGVMTIGALPQIWTLFRQAESDATRLTILDRFLQAEQEINFHINYTLRPEVIRDISKMKFWYPPHIELINRGITPFTIQKLTVQQESELQIFEDTARRATHVGMNDITARDRRAKRCVPPDPNMFLETMATQCALVKILFGTASPLFEDLDELYRACRMAHRDSILNAIRFKQPDWFAHVLWAVTCQSKSFFTKALRNDEISNGKMLQRPMMDIVRAIIVFNEFRQHNTPPELLPGNEQNTNRRQENGQHNNNNRNNDNNGNNGNGGNGNNNNNNNNGFPNKRQRGGGQLQTPTQFPLPQSITAIKAQVQAKNPNISLTRLLREGGKTVRQLLQATNTPDSTCARALFWGECADQQCNFNHKAPLLSDQAIATATTMLRAGAQALDKKRM